MNSSNIFLYNKIDILKSSGINEEIPQFIFDNLNQRFTLRDFQKDAIINTLIYLNPQYNLGKNKQIHLLYHMATGSGKTMVMAMDILYFYSLGYRNFLFFTNRTNIVSKTKINFLDNSSSKFLFNDAICINGERVKVKEVDSFSDSEDNCINICFGTVQGIHSSLTLVKENSLSIEDFENEKVVLIADEAHHLNSTTVKDKEENELNATWEDTINTILHCNKDNVLLEFTATCDVQDKNVLQKYLDKIIFNFDLREFRNAGYTKEFMNMSSSSSYWTRTLQALLMSEFRKLLFEKHHVNIKPVVLLKSKTKKESMKFHEDFFDHLNNLTEKEILTIKYGNQNSDNLFKKFFDFLEDNNVSILSLIELIKQDFDENNCVDMNDLNPNNESIVNNLDEPQNHHRLIFIVDKLTEGWDVLSLFDIVRLYDSRQVGSHGSVSKYTISEAQLIGRGARYCPFKFSNNQVPDKRKYSDYENIYSICETLLYHCSDDSRYINEIKNALKQTGLLPERDAIQVEYKLKSSFKNSDIYKHGFIFANDRQEVDRKKVDSLPAEIRNSGISHRCKESETTAQLLFDNRNYSSLEYKTLDPIKLKDIPHNILNKGYRSFYSTLNFEKLKDKFPNLKSVKEFLLSDKYLGDFPITFIVSTGNTKPSNLDMLDACKKVFDMVSKYIQTIKVSYVGTKEFRSMPINKVFTNRIRNIFRNPLDESWGEGISQNDSLVDSRYKLDLSNKDWFAYSDNFGTSEEKKFVKYFDGIYQQLKHGFYNIYLIRNELQLSIYSFEDGSRFEPDYVLILQGKNQDTTNKENLYICMFIEPKGEHLLQKDSWKGTFLAELENSAVPTVTYVDDNEYKIWGVPLYNETNTKGEVIDYFKKHLGIN